MISLSNLIKSFHYVTVDDKKMIESLEPALTERSAQSAGPHSLDPELTEEEQRKTEAWRDQVIQDAEALAEETLQQARLEAEELRRSAKDEIDSWWEAKRSEDAAVTATAHEQGYAEGYEQGKAEAEQRVLEENRERIEEASAILEAAMRTKLEIIQEAEPFLIELSSSIAEKIMDKQLTLSPEWTIDMIRKVLARRKDKGIVSLCVAPSQFAFIQRYKDELAMCIDSQAELEVLPDATVPDHGCVVRTAMGSLDARIDTQLSEIKHVLMQLATTSGEMSGDGLDA